MRITWYDADGKEIGTGKSLNGIEDGTELYYSVTLSEELGRIYREVKMRKVVANGEPLTCQLEKIGELTLHGIVTSKETAIAGADIKLRQWLNGKYEYTASTKTDENGEFTLKAYNDSTLLTFSAKGYVDKKIERSRLNSAELGTIELEQAKGMVVALQLSYQEAVREGQEPMVQEWYSDTRNITYKVRNVTKDEDMTDFSMQMGDIVLPIGAEVGDRIKVTLISMNGKFAETSGEGVIGDDDTANIAIRLVAYGGGEATVSQKGDDQLLFMLYDGDGQLAASTTSSGSRVTFSGFEAGSYTLVVMGYNGTVGSIGDISDLDSFGLVEGSDYARASVTIRDGIIGSITINDVPELDASKFEYTSLNTSYLPNKTQMTLASYITLTARVDFKAQYTNEVSNVKLMVDIPDGCEFIANSVVVGTKALPHTLNGNQLTITLDQQDIDNRIRFCMMPKQTGTFTSTAYAEFDCRGEKRQSIGSAVFEATAGSISVPSITASKTITVNGIAASHATVDVYDDDQLIGTTTALGDGKWRTDVELYKAYNLSTHEIFAKYHTADGIKATTESKECYYDMNQVKAKSVTMSFYNAWMKKQIDVVFDFETGKTSSTNYSFYTATDFTFVADLTANDTTTVSGVNFYVHTTTKNVRKLKGFFDEKLSRWVAVSKFESNNLPVNLGIEVMANTDGTEALVDRQYIDDEMTLVTQTFEDAKTEAAEINTWLDIKVEPLEDEAIYAELVALTQSDDFNRNKADELLMKLLNNIPVSLSVTNNDVTLEQIVVNSEQRWEEFEEWLAYVQGDGHDSILADLMIDTSIAGQEMPQGSFNAMKENEAGTYQYSVRKLESVDEQALLNDGYTAINMTDGTKLLVCIATDRSLYIDMGTLTEYSFTCSINENEESRSFAPLVDLDPNNPWNRTMAPCFNSLKNLGNLIIKRSINVPNNDAELREYLTYYKQIIDLTNCVYQAARIIINWHLERLVAQEAAINLLIAQDEADIAGLRGYLQLLNENNAHMSANNYFAYQASLHRAEILRQTHTAQATGLNNAISRLRPIVEALPVNCNGTIPTGFMRLLGKLGGGLGAIVDIFNLVNSANVGLIDLQMMINDVEEAARKMPCKGNEEGATRLYNDLIWDAGTVAIHNASIVGMDVIKTLADIVALRDFRPQDAAILWVGSLWVGVINDVNKFWETNRWERMRFQHRARLDALKCNKKTDDNPDDNPDDDYSEGSPTGLEPSLDDLIPIHDPSGYVYEAVPTNRVEGVTATIYFDQEKPTKWDAADFSQVNPQVTDETGLYQWDVPQGMWQVRFEKSGYETTHTNWLPVPPPQLEINIPMSEAVAPTVVKASGMESGITLDFSKYMKPATLEMSGRLSATVNGKDASGDVEMLNLEEDPYNQKVYASKVKFVPSTAFKTSDEVIITVKKEVESYADKQMDADFVAKVKIEPDIKGFECDSIIAVDYQGNGLLEIAVLPAAAAKGRTVSVNSISTMIATTVEQSVTLNDQGKATITVNGNLPGSSSLHLQLDGMDIEKYVEVNVVLHEKVVKTPKASKRSGSIIEAGYLLWLTCNTPGATIYYKLDGSCPCDSTTRKKYTEPFTLPGGEVTVKAIAVRQGMDDSEVVTYTYTVEGNEQGISEVKTDLRIEAEYADGVLTITGAEGCTVRVYDLLGRELVSRKVGRIEDTGELRAGTGPAPTRVKVPKAESYIISVTTNNGQTVVRKVTGR